MKLWWCSCAFVSNRGQRERGAIFLALGDSIPHKYPVKCQTFLSGDKMTMTRSIAKACLAFFLIAGGPALAADNARPDKVSFYFAAHEDDWQLFMNPSAFQDVIAGARKTVFVHVTAGDGGLGLGSAGRKHPFYRARENGAEQAMRFMVNADHTPGAEVDGAHHVERPFDLSRELRIDRRLFPARGRRQSGRLGLLRHRLPVAEASARWRIACSPPSTPRPSITVGTIS